MDRGGTAVRRLRESGNFALALHENHAVRAEAFGFFVGIADPEDRIRRLLLPAIQRCSTVPIRFASSLPDARLHARDPLLLVPFIDLDASRGSGLVLVEHAAHRRGHSPPVVAVTESERQANRILHVDAAKLLEAPFDDTHVRHVLSWAGVLRWQAALHAIGSAQGAHDLPVPAARILLVTAQDRRKSNEEIAHRFGLEVATVHSQSNAACDWFRDSYWTSRKLPGRLTRHQVLEALLRATAKLDKSTLPSPSSSLVPAHPDRSE